MYHDLRDWLDQVDALGQLRRVNGADWDLELGALTDLMARKGENADALLFDEIKGYPAGYRVASGLLNSRERLALTLGLPTEWPSDMAFVQALRPRVAQLELTPPRAVARGPILENEQVGDAVDLGQFPVPRWHQFDGGRYLGTGDLIMTRDPDSGWVNAATYRVMVQDAQHLSLYISPGHQGFLHRERYFALGKPCPVAMCFGCDPLLLIPAGTEVPRGTSEYDYAGGLRGAPIDVIEGSVTGLPFPAHAEIVVEGLLTPNDRRPEGPFGEFTGYYASGSRDEYTMKVERLLYRDDPIITGMLVGRPPHDNCLMYSLIKSAQIWNELERAGVSNVQGVWYHRTAQRFWLVVSIQQRYNGHAKQALGIAAQCANTAYMGRFVIVVDEDVDPSNTDDVLWAMATRCDPERDIDVLRDCWSGPLDPVIPPDRKGSNSNSKALINACRPYTWKDRFPPVAESSPEIYEAVRAKFADVLADRPPARVGR
ncbi:MAG TPA: UbiD family decarboxylase [Chloroflexota bacterium]